MQISVKGFYFLFKMVLPPLMLTLSSPLFFFLTQKISQSFGLGMVIANLELFLRKLSRKN